MEDLFYFIFWGVCVCVCGGGGGGGGGGAVSMWVLIIVVWTINLDQLVGWIELNCM